VLLQAVLWLGRIAARAIASAGRKRLVGRTHGKPRELQIAIIGAGPGGLCMGIRLAGAGFERFPNETTIALNILPAWWMTVWFKLLVGFTILVIIYILVYFRIKRLQNQREKLQELVAERTLELQKKSEMLELQASTLAQKNEELKKSNSTKNKLFSIISHDLRGPFNLILGFQSVFIRDYDKYSKWERLGMVKKTFSASQKVYNLVENLLNWTRIQTSEIQYNPVEFDLEKIIIERMELQLNIANIKGISFENQITKGLIAFADINLLDTVLRNLISNAVKYTTPGGKIIIRTDLRGKNINISVEDSGIGMTKKQIDDLLTQDDIKVERGTEGEKGSGLGLILCREFIEQNKGKLTIESKPGKGSIFSFTIPGTNQT
jgi:signal transduction histidine kinase